LPSLVTFRCRRPKTLDKLSAISNTLWTVWWVGRQENRHE
jgi:hypothetical protein